jgi:hypothetical protein
MKLRNCWQFPLDTSENALCPSQLAIVQSVGKGYALVITAFGPAIEFVALYSTSNNRYALLT